MVVSNCALEPGVVLLACGPSSSKNCDVDVKSQRIVGGAADVDILHMTTEQRAAIGRIVPLPDRGTFCTGILVSQDLILTAKHCVSEVGYELDFPSIQFQVTLDGAREFGTRHSTLFY